MQRFWFKTNYMRKEEKQTEEKKAEVKKQLDHDELVLRADCEGCARKVQECLRGFDGVEDVEIDIETRMITVMGKKLDPSKVMERVRSETHKQVELLSWIPKPPMAKDKKEKPKQETEEEPRDQMHTVLVVLKLDMHCEGCTEKIKRRITRMKGVEKVETDFKSSKATVVGVFDPPKLVEYVYKKVKKHAVILKQEAGKKKVDEDKKEEKKDDGNAGKAEGREKTAKVVKRKDGHEAEGRGETKVVEKKDDRKVAEAKGRGETKVVKKRDGDAVAKAEGRGETKVAGMERNEYYYYQPPPNYANAMGNYPYAPEQIFSDENPNACSVM